MSATGSVVHSIDSDAFPNITLEHDDGSDATEMAIKLTNDPQMQFCHNKTNSVDTWLTFSPNAKEMDIGSHGEVAITIGSSDATSVSIEGQSVSIDGTFTLDSVDINGGTLDGTTIGANSHSGAKFTTLQATGTTTLVDFTASGTSTITTADINGGAIDGTTVGATNHTTGKFTTLQATGTTTLVDFTASGTSTITTADINGGTIDGTSVGATSQSSGKFTTLQATGTTTLVGVTASGTSTLTTVDINGGAIDGTTIGANTPAPGTFVTVTTSSDRRIKENIQQHDCEETHTKVMALKGVDYNLIADPDKERNTGFVAQEVEALFPQFVKEDSKGIKSVNYSQMTSVLVSALQHQQTLIAKLEARLEALEK